VSGENNGKPMNDHSPIPFSPGNLVAAYFRDSGGDTQELSVPQQESVFRRWCNEHNLIPGRVFKDAARPGSSVVDRDQFHDMIHHFRSGQAQEAGLVIWSYNRFAREFDDSQFYRADLRRRGYIFYSLNDKIPEGSVGRLFEAVIDWKNEQFLEDLSRDAKRGLRNLVETYRAIPGTPPRGFRREPVKIGKHRNGQDHIAHRWVPDPEVAPKVLRAFQMRAQGIPLADINAELHLFKGINCYATFFSNKLYTGILEYSDLTIEGYCDPIVDLPTWQTVQNMKVPNKKRFSDSQTNPSRANSRYLLSGLAYCARCGSPMYANANIPKDGAPWESYGCTRARRNRDCDMICVPKKTLEGAVLKELREFIVQPGVIQEHQRTLLDNQAQRLEGVEQRRAEIQTQLAGVRRRMSNLANAIAEGGHNRIMLEKLNEQEAEERGYLAELAEIERQIGTPTKTLSPAEVEALSQHMLDMLSNPDPEAVRDIIQGFVHRVEVDRTENIVHGEVIYYFPFDRKPPRHTATTTSTYAAPVGALLCRRGFTATMRPHKRKKTPDN